MIFDDYLENLKLLFSHHGCFDYGLGDSLKKAVATAEVPNMPGVYLFWTLAPNRNEYLYIGKAGTMITDGSFKDQKLKGRLVNKQDRQPRQQFLETKLADLGLRTMKITWLVTVNHQSRILPAKVEADLLQAYFDEHGTLPPWNKHI